MNGKEFYSWQIDAYRTLEGKSAVLSAPTGSGKTWVAYLWAGLLDPEGHISPPQKGRVIFTAPIKALSNERYLDLRRMGLEVGIETGDFKRNEGAPIICCTQEIYSMKYAGRPGIKLIVDEFHYIFDDPDRARTYIDGIKNTHPECPVLVMSATFGGSRSVGAYLSRIAGRHFHIYETHERMTRLLFNTKKPAQLHTIRDALVFLFSQKGAMELANRIAEKRRDIKKAGKDRLYELAAILEVAKIPMPLYHGVGIYHGGMLPKEKLLVESAFRERILDVVVGTNALALGVNLPAETAIFAQLVRYHDRKPITKNEFLQMAGRAGRKGLFDPGYVTWLQNSNAESRGTDTGKTFLHIIRSKQEKASVSLRPDYGRVLRNEVSVQEEARYISEYSLPSIDTDILEDELRTGLRKISKAIRHIVPAGQRESFRHLLADLWYGEMEVEENLEMAILFYMEDRPHAMTAADIIAPFERNRLQSLLKVKRFAHQIPGRFSFDGMAELDRAVDEIDPTIYGFEEKIGEIEDSLSA